VRRHGGDAGGAGDVAEQERVRVVGVEGGLDGGGDLGAAGGQVDPRRIRPARQRVRDVLRGAWGGGEADDPLLAPRAVRVGEAHDAQASTRAQALVAAGNGLRRRAEHLGDQSERGTSVQLKRMDQTTIDAVEREHIPQLTAI
jgi:hypothetical protein